MVAAINWTTVLVSLIAALPAIIAAIYAAKVNGQIKTPSGPSIGQQVERSHLTAIANNMQLTAMNGRTQEGEPSVLLQQGESPPQVPQA